MLNEELSFFVISYSCDVAGINRWALKFLKVAEAYSSHLLSLFELNYLIDIKPGTLVELTFFIDFKETNVNSVLVKRFSYNRGC